MQYFDGLFHHSRALPSRGPTSSSTRVTSRWSNRDSWSSFLSSLPKDVIFFAAVRGRAINIHNATTPRTCDAFRVLVVVFVRGELFFSDCVAKQNEKLNFGLPIETQSRMLARLSRSTRQHPGQIWSFCSVIDLEAQFDRKWRRSSVNAVN